jgi:ABC-2 type transport system permease protein
VLILAIAHAQGVQTAAWTSVSGLFAWLVFFGNEVLCLIGVCLLGMLIAVLTRSTGIAVGAALAYVLVPEGIIAMVWNEGSRWFPIRTFNFLPGSVFPTDVGPTPPQGYTAALLVALGWMTVFIVGSFVAFRRQDINA